MARTSYATFARGNLMRHVTVMSLSTSVGLMAIFAVDLIDLVFISMLGHHHLAVAAGYASAIMFFTSSVNIGLSIAAGVLAASSIGAGKAQEAREYATSTAMFVLIIGAILPLIILPNITFLLSLLGATGDEVELAASYLWIILPFTFLSGLSMVVVSVLRAYGESSSAMYPSFFGAVTNAALDPLLMFSLGLGLNGAAWATVLARFVTLAFALYPALRKHSAFAFPRVRWLSRDFLAVSKLAVPGVLTNVATPVGTAIVTREMAKFGAEAVAGMAIIGRLTPVAFAVVLALSSAIGPIIGQNYGANSMERVHKTFIEGLKFLAVYVVGMALILFMFRVQIADLFDAQGQARSLIYLFSGPLALAAFFNGAIFVSNAAFSNLGHPSYSTWINWGRNTLGTWPFALAGAAVWGAPGVLIGQALGGIAFALLAIWLGLRVIHTKTNERTKHLFHNEHFGHRDLHLHRHSVHGRG